MPTPNPTRPYTIPGFRIALVREPGVKLAERPELRSPAEAAPMLAQYIGETDREVFAVALLTVRHRVLGLHTVSVGCLTASLVHPREVFKPAILAGSAALIVAHNHPSGDPEPSAEDVVLTRRLAAAGQLLGIEILDHLVIGEAGRFVSLGAPGRPVVFSPTRFPARSGAAAPWPSGRQRIRRAGSRRTRTASCAASPCGPEARAGRGRPEAPPRLRI